LSKSNRKTELFSKSGLPMSKHDDGLKTQILVGGLFFLVAASVAAIALMIS
jgi:hypothetical protein